MVNVPYKYSYELYDANRSKRILICFLLSPLLGFVLALKNIKQKSAFGVMFAFALLVGLCMDVPIDRINGDLNVDATTYREYFEEVSVSQNFGGWCEGLISFISLTGEEKDYFLPTLSFFASSILNNYHVLFLFGAAFFAFFELKNIRYLVLDEKFKMGVCSLFLLYIFNSFNISTMSTLRFPMASSVFIYVIFKYYFEDNHKVLWLMLLLPFMHGAYFFVLPLFILLSFFKKYEKFWMAVFVIGSFFSFGSHFFQSLLESFTPSFLQGYITAEVGDEAIESYGNANSSRASVDVIGVLGVLKNVYLFVIVLILLLKSKSAKMTLSMRSLYLLFLSFYSFATMISFIPYASSRFRDLMMPLFAVLWLNIIPSESKYNKLLLFVPVAYSYEIALDGYLYYRLMNFSFWFLSPLISVPYMLFFSL